tara:strand:- start:594 stop:725 length:132 start_codon:yes stop_codon:yes gene_type:complete
MSALFVYKLSLRKVKEIGEKVERSKRFNKEEYRYSQEYHWALL